MSRFTLLLAVVLGAGAAVGVRAQEAKPSAKPAKPVQSADAAEAAAMKKMMELGSPGPMHKWLQPFAGEWDMAVRWWQEGPNKPPSESKGTSSAKWILDGRFLQIECRSKMMGQPFTHLELLGYDNARKQFVSLWTTNMETGLTVSHGTPDAAGKAVTFVSLADSPASGERDKPTKYVHRLAGPDRRVIEVFDWQNGDFVRTVELTFTRSR